MLRSFLTYIIILLIAFASVSKCSIICETNGTTDYAYNLPDRNIVSCPIHQQFTFSCHTHHIINIDQVIFSPFLPNPTGECTADWSAECKDKENAFNYLKNKCNSRDTCTVGSVELRSKTKCQLNEVISIHYKCIPTWEVMEVPIKCDLCKNVTYTSGLTPNFGFLHSTWYPNLQPHVTCHSQIQNKPNHVVVMYTVTGFIGPDKILIETYNEYGIYINQIITGNISTNLILTSNYNVNITILPTTYEIFNQPNFLLYYYVVPKCEYMLCPDPPVYPIYTSPITTPTTTTTTTTKATTTSTTTTTTDEQNTFAPPLIADKKEGAPPTITDAWLAAILALAYACIMIIAVLGAVWYRRRRKANNITDTQIILSPSMVSTSRVMTPHTQSRLSMRSNGTLSLKTRDYQTELFAHEQQQQARIEASRNEHNNTFSREQTYEEYTGSHIARVQGHQGMLRGVDQLGVNGNLNSGFSEFDTFSQVISDSGDNFSNVASVAQIVQMRRQEKQSQAEMSNRGVGIFSESSRSGAFRTVEYSRNPDGEIVRMTNIEAVGDDVGEEVSAQALKIDRINMKKNFISMHNVQETKKTVTLTNEESYRPKENETQEMSMFVNNDDYNVERAFKIDINNNNKS